MSAAAPRVTSVSLEGVTVVSTLAEASRVAALVAAAPRSTYHAWDTEVVGIDLSAQSPVTHGTVICASFYSGPGVDYGSGPRVWIDTLDGEPGLLAAFAPVLGDSTVRKVWHNYGFDRHVLANAGVDVRGLGGDTMHMARLWNTALNMRGGYSLEALSALLLDARKVPMRELFSVPRVRRDGSPSKVRELPPLDAVQRDTATREAWIRYSTYDAEATWKLREALEARLRARPWAAGGSGGTGSTSLWDFYDAFLRPFGELLTDMERAGIAVDAVERLPAAERAALAERAAAERTFLCVSSMCVQRARVSACTRALSIARCISLAHARSHSPLQ